MTVHISSNLVITPGSNLEPPFPLTHARIAYESFVDATKVSASSEADLRPATAAVNPLGFEWWSPSSVPTIASPETWTLMLDEQMEADYIGIGVHNLAGAEVGLEYSADGETWTSIGSFIQANNSPILSLFQAVYAMGWRITIHSAPTLPRLGAIYIGKALQMQRRIYAGHSPITLSRQTDMIPNRTEGGQWAGRTVIRMGVSTKYQWDNLTASWYRQYFDPFVKAARSRPFFIAWYPSKFPGEVGFCWTTGDIQPSNSGKRDLMSVGFDVVGLTGE